MTGDIKHIPTLESVVCICKSVEEWKIAKERGIDWGGIKERKRCG